MTQALFRIGGVYRNGNQSACVITRALGDDAVAVGLASAEGGEELGCTWRLSDGVCIEAERNGGVFSGLYLIPGELHNFNGQWLPVEEKAEQPRAPYFAEALEDEPAKGTRLGDLLKQALARPLILKPKFLGIDWAADAKCLPDPNAAMLARDAANYIARPAAPVVIQEPAKTSHGPIAGLTFLENRDHRFGLFRF